MRLKLLFIFLFLVLIIAGYPQTLTENNSIEKHPTVIPAQPSSASLMKFVDIPVSYYTGVPNISIPLYEIVSGDLKIPISISYHAGGIQVDEEAGTIGLGWAINYGGSIVQNISGYNDFISSASQYGINSKGYKWTHQFFDRNNEYSIYNMSYYRPNFLHLGNYLYGTYDNYHFIPICQKDWQNENNWLLLNDTRRDINEMGENELSKDIFNYHFDEFSGKAVLRYASTLRILNQDKISLITNVFGNNIKGYKQDGTVYTFNPTSYSWYNEYYKTFGKNIGTSITYDISSIQSSKGNKIVYNYDYDTWVEKNPKYSCNYGWYSSTDCGCLNYSNPENLAISISKTTEKLKYVKRIDYDNGFVLFSYSNREDNGLKKIDKIEIYYNNGILLKEFVFYYSYFVGDVVFGEFDKYSQSMSSNQESIYNWVNNAFGQTPFLPSSDYRSKRLKLDSVIENINNIQKKYKFKYKQGQLPYKTSFAKDYWGYFNGKLNNNLVPDNNRYKHSLSQSFTDSRFNTMSVYSVANREPDELYVANGLLEYLYYPTGGFTKFEYESNDYTLTQYDVDHFENGTKGTTVKGCGVRVKSITDYDGINSNGKQRKFFYQLEDQTSSGLLQKPIVFNYSIEYDFNSSFCNGFLPARSGALGDIQNRCSSQNTGHKNYLFTEATVNPSYSLQCSDIGYSKVKMQYGSNNEGGASIYEYFNEQDSEDANFDIYTQPNLPAFNQPLNGFLVAENHYVNNQQTTVKSINYEYSNPVDEGEVDYTIIQQYDNLCMSKNNLGDFWIYFLPIIHHELNLLKRTENINGVITTATYEYSQDGFALLKKITETRSDKKNNQTEYYYPNDFSNKPTTLQNMINKNIVNKIIEIVHLVDDKIVSSEFNEYDALNRGLLTQIYKLNISSLTSKSSFNYSKNISTTQGFQKDSRYFNNPEIIIQYDDVNGNIIQSQCINDYPISYLWGYNNTLPVAKIDNATYAQIQPLLPTNFQSLTGTALKDALENLRTNSLLSGAIMHHYTYDPLIGMKTETDPNGLTTFYDYDLFGRLSKIKNNDNKVLKVIKYNYKK